MSLRPLFFPVTTRPGLRAAVVLAVFLSAAGVLAQTGTPRSAPPATGQQESPIPRYMGGSGAASAGQWERWDINAHFNGKAPITPQLNPGTASFGGLSSTGRLTTACIANPAAPAVAQYGATGSTILSYLLVCHDSNGGVTAPSAATTIVNAAATLSAANYVLISWPAVTGCSSWDVLKGNTSTALATGVTGLFVNDTGQATAAYTAPARNSTCDIAGSGIASAAPAISGFSVNGVLNPLTFPGADIGAQINSAITANTSGATIQIPPGNYSFGTTIQCPTTAQNRPFIIRGAGQPPDSATAGGTTLNYTGTADAVSQVMGLAYQNAVGCQLRDLTLDGSGAGAAAVGFHFGGTNYSGTNNVVIQYFGGAGVEIENVANGGGAGFTERYNLRGSFYHNAVGIYFHCGSNCNNSAEHGLVDAFFNVGPTQVAVKADGGILTNGTSFLVNGNVEGVGSGGTLFLATGAGTGFGSAYRLSAECSETSCTRFSVGPGATIGGIVEQDYNGLFSDSNSGTLNVFGFDSLTSLGALSNLCAGTVTLSSGTGTFTNVCVTTGSHCTASDQTAANAVKVAAAGSGSVAVAGTGSDVLMVVCQ